ncbi:hypothetical protein Mapa_006592 [Marchantia paleacea]|nr:hypothetical protein Mapa_006592 [Marchantia paleacea]
MFTNARSAPHQFNGAARFREACGTRTVLMFSGLHVCIYGAIRLCKTRIVLLNP